MVKNAFNQEDTEGLRKLIYERVRNNPGYLANKVEVTTLDPTGAFLKKLEERLRTNTKPSQITHLWKEGPVGYSRNTRHGWGTRNSAVVEFSTTRNY